MKSIALMMLASGTGAEAQSWKFGLPGFRSMFNKNGYGPIATEPVAGIDYPLPRLPHPVTIEEKTAQEKSFWGITKSFVQYDVRIECTQFLDKLETNNTPLNAWMDWIGNKSFWFSGTEKKSLTLKTRYSLIKSWIEHAKLKTKKHYTEWANNKGITRPFVSFPPKHSLKKFCAQKKFLQDRRERLQKILENLLQDENVLQDFISFHAEKNGYQVQEFVFDNNLYMLVGKKYVSEWDSFKKDLACNIEKMYLAKTFYGNDALEKFQNGGKELSAWTLQKARHDTKGDLWLRSDHLNVGNYSQAYAKQVVLKAIVRQLQSDSMDKQDFMQTSLFTKRVLDETCDHDYKEAEKFEKIVKKDVHNCIKEFFTAKNCLLLRRVLKTDCVLAALNEGADC